MATIDPLPPEAFEASEDLEQFAESCAAADTIYFLLNVGNGDTQLLLLPEEDGIRRAIVVDVATKRKLPALLAALAGAGLFPAGSYISLLVATHPHSDHMHGIPDLLARFGGRIDEYWDPAYHSPHGFYMATMAQLARRSIAVLHPTSGTQRLLGSTLVTVLAPAVLTKNRYDTHWVDPNNASIALRIDFPVRRAARSDDLGRAVGRVYLPVIAHRQRIVLGADTQTEGWATVLTDFPRVDPRALAFAQLRAAVDTAPLRAQVFKVPHHASKRGLNLELVERIDPKLSLVTADGSGRGHAFPHRVAVDALREALEKIATQTNPTRSDDWALGIHYTGASMSSRSEEGGSIPLGSIAVVMSPTGTKRELWRFCDPPVANVVLKAALRYVGPGR